MILPLYTVRKKNARKSPNYMPKYKKDKKNKNIFCKVKFLLLIARVREFRSLKHANFLHNFHI